MSVKYHTSGGTGDNRHENTKSQGNGGNINHPACFHQVNLKNPEKSKRHPEYSWHKEKKHQNHAFAYHKISGPGGRIFFIMVKFPFHIISCNRHGMSSKSEQRKYYEPFCRENIHAGGYGYVPGGKKKHIIMKNLISCNIARLSRK